MDGGASSFFDSKGESEEERIKGRENQIPRHLTGRADPAVVELHEKTLKDGDRGKAVPMYAGV